MGIEEQSDRSLSKSGSHTKSDNAADDSGHSRGSIRFPLEPGDWGDEPARPMNRKRFLLGFLLAGSGIGIMLAVAVGALQTAGLNGGLSLPSVALCMVAGVMLLGGGFGIMATSSAQFDDGGPTRPPLTAAAHFQKNPLTKPPTLSGPGGSGTKDPAARRKVTPVVDQSA
ncbi:MAG TPA: hypothetical protein DCG12_18280 [Planctomycetaceae bacterium]|nr:hypothetical protein [Planctomycetaceae bacterium]